MVDAIRYVLIDPATRSTCEGKAKISLDFLYKQIGCQAVDGFGYKEHFIFVDDLGLYRRDAEGLAEQTWLVGLAQPLVGPLVVVGPCDEDGSSLSATATLEEIGQWIVKFETGPLQATDFFPQFIAV